MRHQTSGWIRSSSTRQAEETFNFKEAINVVSRLEKESEGLCAMYSRAPFYKGQLNSEFCNDLVFRMSRMEREKASILNTACKTCGSNPR